MKGVRIIYILVSILVVGMIPMSANSFGVSLFIFGFGMVYDYLQVVYSENYSKGTKIKKCFGAIGLIISVLFCLFGFMVLINCVDLVQGSKETLLKNNPLNFAYFPFCIKFKTFIWGLVLFPVLAAIEILFPVKRLNNLKETQPA